MPKGSDAVVMQEDTRSESESPQTIQILDAAKPWENVRLQGEDAKKGASAADRGHVLTIGHINLLAATGCAQARVGLDAAEFLFHHHACLAGRFPGELQD